MPKTATAMNAQQKADQDRQNQQMRAWNAYFGRFAPPLRTKKGINDNVIVNRCRPVVNKGVSFLFGKPIDFEVPGTAARAKSAQKYLDATWSSNRKMSLLNQLGVNGGVTGQGLIRILLTQPYPTLKVIDSSLMTVTTLPDDVDTVTSYNLMYQTIDGGGNPVTHKQMISVAPDTQTWLITDQVQGQQGWVQTAAPAEWPYPFAPIVSNQNLPAPNRHWGIADLEGDVIQINDDINFILSNTAAILRYHANPKTIGKGFNADQIRQSADNMMVLPTNEASVEMLEMTNDLSSSKMFLDALRSAMDELTHVPSIALGTLENIPSGTISGVALQTMYQPLLEKTYTKRQTYGDMLTELNSRLLVIGGYQAADCVNHWPDIEPYDPLENIQVAQAWQGFGVSKRTLFAKIGLDYDAEMLNIADETEADADSQPAQASNVQGQDSEQAPETVNTQEDAPTVDPTTQTAASSPTMIA